MVETKKRQLEPELESLQVYGNVNPSHRGFGVSDPNTPASV